MTLGSGFPKSATGAVAAETSTGEGADLRTGGVAASRAQSNQRKHWLNPAGTFQAAVGAHQSFTERSIGAGSRVFVRTTWDACGGSPSSRPR